MHWHNEPAKWSVNENTITVRAELGTDFWRLTSYRDNGHFYYQPQAGDFQADVKFSGEYAATYDQAGLMVRVNETTWVKCGIEYVDGAQKVSAVVTREFSDWSVVPLAHNPASLWLRLKREGAIIEVHYALDGLNYQLLRQAYFSSTESVDVGIMCASPGGTGFSVIFEGLAIQNIFPKRS